MRPTAPLVACLLLAGCGASPADLAFEACEAYARDATERNRTYSEAQKRSFVVDASASRATAREIEAGVIELTVVASIDSETGVSTRQDFNCRTRVNPGQKLPDVINFNFIFQTQ